MPSRRRLVLTIAAAALGLAVLAAPAGAATKPFSMVVSPTSAPAGQSTTFSVSLTNRTSQQQLGSANITVPSAFSAVSVADPPGAATATTNGNVVQLRDASVPPGGVIVVSVTATVPSACGATYTWAVVAKQANDFNGPPGNDLTLDPTKSSVTTSVTCGTGQVTVVCVENETCSASIVNGDTTFAVTAPGNAGIDAGLLILSNGTGVDIDCAGYNELTATQTVIDGPNRAKTVTSTIDKRVMNAQPNNGASFLQMCFGAPYTFATRPDSTLEGVDTDGNGINDFFYGLLPDCGPAPCVSSRNKTNAGDGVIVTRAPASSLDPAYRP